MNGAFRWDPTVARSMATLMQNQNPQSAQTDWGFASAVGGHAFGTMPDLPGGYNRTSFNEERELASKGFTSGFGAAATAFGATVGATYAIWGSPVKDLAARFPNPLTSAAAATTGGVYSAAYKVGQGMASSAAMPFGHAGGWVAGQATRGVLNTGHWAAGRAANFLSLGGTDAIAGKMASWGTSMATSGAEGLASIAATNPDQVRFGATNFNKFKVAFGEILSQSTFHKGTAKLAGGMARLGASAAGATAGFLLNPMTLAGMYASDKAIGYAGNIMTNFETEHQAEKDMVAKSDRILQFGGSDTSRGLAGGMTSAQRGRLVDTMKGIAVSSAMSSDLMGMGKNSIFGGQTAYTERFKELKSMLSVGTDMGMFDASKSFDDFEKKFVETVKVVDKMSKMIRKTKGEVMALVGSMQNEGVFNANEAGRAIGKRDFAARATGVDIGTTMMEANMGAQMGMQAGFSSLYGSSRMTENRLVVGRAKRTGLLSREDIFRLGGEQNVITEMTAADMSVLQDKNVLTEMARMVTRDEVTGEIKFDKGMIDRGKAAASSHSEAVLQGRVRVNMRNGRSFSKLVGADIEGGEFIDKSQIVKEALAKGIIDADSLTEIRAYTQQQEMMANRPGSSMVSKREALRMNYIRNGVSADVADMMARQYSGEFSGEMLNETLAVKRDRITEEREQNKVGSPGYYASRIAGGALHILGSVFGGFSPGLKPSKNATQISEDIYTAVAAQSGKEAETREAFRYRGLGESDSSVLASTTYQERLNLLKHGKSFDMSNTALGKTFAQLEGVTSAYMSGTISSLTSNKNADLRKRMAWSNLNTSGVDSKGRNKSDTLASFFNIEGEGVDSEIRNQLLGDGPIVMNEGNAAKLANLLETAKVTALSREGLTEKQRLTIESDYKGYGERIKLGSSAGPSLSEFKMIAERKHQLFSGRSEAAREYFKDGYIVNSEARRDFFHALGGMQGVSDMAKLKGISLVGMDKIGEKLVNTLKGGGDVSDEELLFLRDITSVAGTRALAKGSERITTGSIDMSREEALKYMQRLGAKDEGLGLLLDAHRGAIKDTKNINHEVLSRVRKLIGQADDVRNWDKNNTLRSEIVNELSSRQTILGAQGKLGEDTDKIVSAVKEFVKGDGSDVSKLSKSIADTGTKLSGLSSFFDADKIALLKSAASGEDVSVKRLIESGMKLDVVKNMESKLRSENEGISDSDLKSLLHKQVIDSKSEYRSSLVKEVSSNVVASVSSAVDSEGKPVEGSTSDGSPGGVTNESISKLRDASMILRECLVALRLL